jgi:putative transposase
MKTRREFTPEYKAKIVIETLREERTMSEIAARETISVKQLGNWKSEFLANAGRAFSQSRDERELAKEINIMQSKEKSYQAKVGQLTLEVDFLKDVHEKVHGRDWKNVIGYIG